LPRLRITITTTVTIIIAQPRIPSGSGLLQAVADNPNDWPIFGMGQSRSIKLLSQCPSAFLGAKRTR